MRIYLLITFLLIPSYVYAASFTGQVVSVSDGDTIQVMHNGKAEKIRLAGIDCPEKDQPFGQAAKRFTLDLSAHNIVTVKIETTDRYGRTVAEVILPDGKRLNRELVREGYAWWYRRYSKDKALADLESHARESRKGLWADKNPVPPWEWRRGKRIVSVVPEKVEHPSKNWACGQKHYCEEMVSCEEAKFYFSKCGLKRLDGDRDGVPCEALCF